MEMLTVGEAEAGLRLDVFLASRLSPLSRATVQKLMEAGAVLLNGEPARANARPRAGDTLTVDIPDIILAGAALPETLPLEIVYEDDDLLVVNKAKGMVVHPAPGSLTGTLVNALLGRGTTLAPLGGDTRPGIVHRLDKDTSGLMLVAKTDFAYAALQKQIQAHAVVRQYVALLWGVPPWEQAKINAPLARHPNDRTRQAVADSDDDGAREAVTELRVVERLAGEFSWVEATLQTGRTHQIRVHCAFAGFPVVGDSVYSGRRRGRERQASDALPPDIHERIAHLHGQALHAHRLAFTHPRTGRTLQFDAAPPAEVQDLLEVLRIAGQATPRCIG